MITFMYVLDFYVCFRYVANKSMEGRAMCNADGDFLIVPQHGSKFSHNSFTLFDPFPSFHSRLSFFVF